MLQRAASNAYSWWWASHIRTKQSKWLEQNLQDMEEKVKFMLKLIEEDGDSFAKRAEMYFRRRPELIKFVEESYRAYRALAERYDHISGELQSANNTIATVFPEQVQFAIDDEEDHDISQRMSSNPLDQPSLPKDLPEPPKAQMLKVLSIKKKEREREGLITLLKKKANSMNIISSNLSKPEALEEIDKLQKEILALQTEKEFVKSSYESRLAKYWEIGKRITEVQEKVCNLQDEFSLSTVIEDDEARTLMASTALESCRNTLTQLQEKQERLSEEAKLENRRINIAHEKLEAFKDEFLPKQIEQWNPFVGEDDFVATDTNLKFSESLEDGRFESEMKTNGNLKIDPEASLTAIEMAEKINELVAEVISLESVVSSQTGLIKRLRLEMDELQAQLQSFEDDKGIKMDSKRMREKLEELDKKLEQVQNLNKNIDQQNNNTRSQFTEAHSNIDRLSEKLQSMKYLDEEIEVMAPKQEVGEILSQIIEHEDQEDLMIAPSYDLENIKEEGLVEERTSTNLDDLAEDNQELNPFNDVPEQSSFRKENNWIDFDQEDELKEEDQPDWKQLFLNGLEDRERTLLGEYTSTLRSYKETKKRLSELEKKNQDSLFEATMQVRELKGSNAMKDEEIRSLRQKLNLLETTSNENNSRTELEYQDIKATGRPNESSSKEVSKVVNGEEEKGKRNDKEFNMMLIDERQILSSTEEKFRRDIDELLEENLEFWLRFSTSFHHIQKFQTVIQDLQSDFLKLKANKKQADSNSNTSSIEQSLKSEARPIYVHLREIQTELDIWLEESVSLKEELQFRFSSLCNVQEEISRALRASSETEDMEFTTYQAAKFQGEVLNMQQENNKVANELQTGLDHVRGLQFEIDKTLSKMNQDFKLSESKKHHPDTKHSISRARIPLRSFIFGVKSLKQKPTIFSCMNPPLQKNYSDLKGHIPI